MPNHNHNNNATNSSGYTITIGNCPICLNTFAQAIPHYQHICVDRNIRAKRAAQRAKIAEKVHKPPQGFNVIKFEFNGSIWVPWSPSDPKNHYALMSVFKFIYRMSQSVLIWVNQLWWVNNLIVLWFLVASGGLEICVSSISFQKNDIAGLNSLQQKAF